MKFIIWFLACVFIYLFICRGAHPKRICVNLNLCKHKMASQKNIKKKEKQVVLCERCGPFTWISHFSFVDGTLFFWGNEALFVSDESVFYTDFFIFIKNLYVI